MVFVYEGKGCEEEQSGKSNGCGGRPGLASRPRRDVLIFSSADFELFQSCEKNDII